MSMNLSLMSRLFVSHSLNLTSTRVTSYSRREDRLLDISIKSKADVNHMVQQFEMKKSVLMRMHVNFST